MSLPHHTQSGQASESFLRGRSPPASATLESLFGPSWFGSPSIGHTLSNNASPLELFLRERAMASTNSLRSTLGSNLASLSPSLYPHREFGLGGGSDVFSNLNVHQEASVQQMLEQHRLMAALSNSNVNLQPQQTLEQWLSGRSNQIDASESFMASHTRSQPFSDATDPSTAASILRQQNNEQRQNAQALLFQQLSDMREEELRRMLGAPPPPPPPGGF
jgi:hypothetical protein